MKLYQTVFHDRDEGCCYSWHTSHGAAHRELRRLQRERNNGGGVPLGPELVQEVILPDTRRGLVAWLNQYFTRDNG